MKGSLPLKRAIAKDVAERAGVSIPVVSYVFSGKAKQNRISDETIERVLQAAKELDYQPSVWGKILKTQRSNLFLLVTHNISDGHTGRLVRTVIAAARARGCHVMALDIDSDEELIQDGSCSIAASMVDGVIVHGFHTADLAHLAGGRLRGTPACVMGHQLDAATVPWVEVDNHVGAQLAVRHLLDQGCRTIGVVSDETGYGYIRSRLDGVRQALEGRDGVGLLIHYREPGQGVFDTGASAVEHWLRNKELPQGIFALGDTFALGVLSALNRRGIACPGDVKVVGFDGDEGARYASPPLSTVVQPLEAMAEAAFEILEAALDDKESPDPQRLLAPELVVRASSSIAEFE